MAPFNHVVVNEQDLRAIVGTPGPRSVLKERRALDEHTRAFIACSPFLLMATSDASGRCDVSPKGDAPGFVQVLDDQRLVIPERPGNKRLDGMLNMMANPHVGLIFLVPGDRRRCASTARHGLRATRNCSNAVSRTVKFRCRRRRRNRTMLLALS